MKGAIADAIKEALDVLTQKLDEAIEERRQMAKELESVRVETFQLRQRINYLESDSARRKFRIVKLSDAAGEYSKVRNLAIELLRKYAESTKHGSLT